MRTRAGDNDTATAVHHQFGMHVNVYNPCVDTKDKDIKNLIYLEGFDMMDFIPNSLRDAQEYL